MITLTFVKSTKNFHKFEAIAPGLGSLYIPITQMPTPPATIQIPLS